MVTDNFYTSLALALMYRKTNLLGTLRKNRIGNSKNVTGAKLKKVDTNGRECSGVLEVKWRNRDVLMLSTKHVLNEVFTGKNNRNHEDINWPNGSWPNVN